MASNESFMVSIDAGDRRMAILPIISARAGDREYGNRLKDAIEVEAAAGQPVEVIANIDATWFPSLFQNGA